MPVNVKINKDIEVDVRTPAEKNAGKISVNINKGTNIDIVPTVDIHVNKNTIKRESKGNFRRAINGDYMMFAHGHIDIMVLVEQKKVVAFAKDVISDNVYGAEKRLFDYLKKQGIIQYDSIQGGNIYGSMEAKILNAHKSIKKPFALVLDKINEWIQKEKPMFNALDAHDDMMQDNLLNPDDEHATELGEVPHEEEKGSILQKNLFAPYLYGRYTY